MSVREKETTIQPLGAKQSTLVAAAGEYFVLARLSFMGKIAAHAPRGVPNADIVVSSVDGDTLCAVQVKARSGHGGDAGWHMSKKHEEIKSPRLFYAFVDFGSDFASMPTTYVVPSGIVAQVIRDMHQAWLATPGRKGQQHNDSDFRRFMPDYTINCGSNAPPYTKGWLDEYHENWHLLP
jgi:hypothetical protein